jgi:branched-chain amino acid transport system substrate-binding protein
VKRALPLVAALVLLLATQRAAVPADEPFVIPTVLSLTGPAAFLGKSEAQTLQILEKMLNRNGGIKGRPVHFDVLDDQTSAKVAVQLANDILARHPAVILGSDIVSSCSAMEPLLKDGTVLYCTSPGALPEPGSYEFGAGVAGRDLMHAYVRYMLAHGLHRIGAVWSTDAVGQDGERQLTNLLALPESSGLQVVANEHFNPTDLSVTAQMAHLAAAGAQMCLCWTTGSAFTTLLRTYTEAGLTFPIMTSTGNMTYAQMTAYANLSLGSILFVGFPYNGRDAVTNGPVKRAIDAFNRAFDEAGVKPDSAPGDIWDPATIIVSLYRKLGTNATATQIHDELLHLRGFAGIDGVYDFVATPQLGINDTSAVMTRWDAGKGTWVAIR